VYSSVYWFDGLFIPDEQKQNNPKTHTILTLGTRINNRGEEEYDFKFRAKYRLPHFQNKIDLIFSDANTEEGDELPLESLKSSSEISDPSFAASIRMIHNESKDKFLDSRIGMSGGDLFTRIRYKNQTIHNEKHHFTFEPSVNYYIKAGAGAKLSLEYQYNINTDSIFRWNYSLQKNKSDIRDVWKQGFYLLQRTTTGNAYILGLQIGNINTPLSNTEDIKYTTSFRFRTKGFKSWMHFEIEPFFEWDQYSKKHSTGLALRVEGVFTKN